MPTAAAPNPLDSEARRALIERVLSTAYKHTETWRSEDHLGVDLAYLAWAIVTANPTQAFVVWDDQPPILALFREWFPPADPVWQFIKTKA